MGTKYHKTICSCWIIMFLATLDTISQGFVEGLQPLDKTKFGPAPKGTMKSIEVPEDGDIIDCVDIYQQPAFNGQCIKNLQMAPSKSYLSLFNKTRDRQPNLIQNWLKYGECRKGTIPIRRVRNNNGTIHRKTNNDGFVHEYAIGQEHGSIYHGVGATFNVWNPRIREHKEFSLAQFWVVSGNHPFRNTIEAGWIVNPHHYHDTRTRLFTYWTGDDYNRTGCYDIECAGFVQTNRRWVLGGALNSISTYQGEQVDMRITVARDYETKHWWLEVQGTKIGFFNASKIPGLADGANLKVEFGGEIINQQPGHKHTGTHMGSGHFSHEGFGKASFVRNIQIANDHYDTVDASLESDMTRPECYDLIFGPPETNYGTHFFYGGPGFSRHCYVG